MFHYRSKYLHPVLFQWCVSVSGDGNPSRFFFFSLQQSTHTFRRWPETGGTRLKTSADPSPGRPTPPRRASVPTRSRSPESGGKIGIFAGRASSVSMLLASPACRFFARRLPLCVTGVKPSSVPGFCVSISAMLEPSEYNRPDTCVVILRMRQPPPISAMAPPLSWGGAHAGGLKQDWSSCLPGCHRIMPDC